MSDKPTPAKNRLIKGLGASRTMTLSDRPAQGPLGLLQLRAEVAERLRSTGGRPTDQSWSISRLVRFDPDRWEALERLAAQLSEGGRKVSPAQLAALLVERGLEDLERQVEEGQTDSVTQALQG